MAPVTMSDWDEPDEIAALGEVLSDDRGGLPFALLHGESLVACAAWAMGAAEIELVDLTVTWESLRASGRPLVLHDSLCPATPAGFLARALEQARTTGRVVVGARPVTDTMKQVSGERVGAGADRETLVQLASPVVLPAAVVAALEQPPRTGDPAYLLEDIVAAVGAAGIEWLEAPESARRIADEADLRVLEAATRPDR